jgi:CelD/BcsL family acetyltransferase involved in cellulose biosynthesis
MADLISLQSKLLAAAVAQRDAPRWRRMSRKELDQILDPCAWHEPVYAWLLANHAEVVRVRQHRNGWNRMHWAEIARIMEVEGVKGIARRAAQRQLGA